MADDDLTEYARDLQQSVLLDAGIEGAEQMRSEVFTRHVIDILVEAGELENALPCHLRERGIEVHGYGIDDEDTLNLLTTIYSGDVPPGSVSRTELDKALQRLINFWDRCRSSPTTNASRSRLMRMTWRSTSTGAPAPCGASGSSS